jgi:hypothetical protein
MRAMRAIQLAILSVTDMSGAPRRRHAQLADMTSLLSESSTTRQSNQYLQGRTQWWATQEGALFAAAFADPDSGLPWIREAFVSRGLYESSFCSSSDVSISSPQRSPLTLSIRGVVQRPVPSPTQLPPPFDMIRRPNVFPRSQAVDIPDYWIYRCPRSSRHPRDLRTAGEANGGGSSLVSHSSDSVLYGYHQALGCYQGRLKRAASR